MSHGRGALHVRHPAARRDGQPALQGSIAPLDGLGEFLLG